MTSHFNFQRHKNEDHSDDELTDKNAVFDGPLTSGARKYFVNMRSSSSTIPAFKLANPDKERQKSSKIEAKESLSAAELKEIVSKKIGEIQNKQQSSVQKNSYVRLSSDKPSRSELRKIAIAKNKQNSCEFKPDTEPHSKKKIKLSQKKNKALANRRQEKDATNQMVSPSVAQKKTSKFDLSGKTEIAPIVPIKRDLSHSIQKLLEKKAKLQKLEKVNPEKAAQIVEKEAWSNAIARVQGAKIVDDPNILRNALKRKQKQKEKSTKEWKKRLESQKTQKKPDNQRTQKKPENQRTQKKLGTQRTQKKPASNAKKRPGFEGVSFKKSKGKK